MGWLATQGEGILAWLPKQMPLAKNKGLARWASPLSVSVVS
jgi:hypothetical protein